METNELWVPLKSISQKLNSWIASECIIVWHCIKINETPCSLGKTVSRSMLKCNPFCNIKIGALLMCLYLLIADNSSLNMKLIKRHLKKEKIRNCSTQILSYMFSFLKHSLQLVKNLQELLNRTSMRCYKSSNDD